MRVAAAPVASLAAKTPSAVGEPTGEVLAPQSTEDPQTASGSAETSFAAILDAAELVPAASASATATEPASAAKAATGAESTSAPSTTPTPAPPVPLGAVPMTIALRALRDASRFEIRLDPLELGRIDVQLDIDREAGTVSADLVVDRPATLALLQRDASALQQALSQAGLDASAGISLSLRDGASGQQRDGGGPHGQGSRHGTAPGQRHDTPADIIDPVPLRALRLSGLDIRI